MDKKVALKDAALWQTIQGEVELTISRASYITWFKNTRVLRQEENVLTIGVPNIFTKTQMESKYKALLDELLEKNNASDVVLEFKIHSSVAHSRKPEKTSEEVVVITEETRSGQRQPQLPVNGPSAVAHSYRQGLNNQYTFDSFVVGGGNDLAYAACQAISNNPGTKYNPLFVYGDSGLGKTHLIQAVGNEITKKFPGSNIVYVASEQFVQEFLDSIRYKKISDFTAHYRSADVLIVDDIQFFAGKEKTQEEFFHTFNALRQADKQIIISSDKPPKSIPNLEDRLRSRFEWGMSVDISAPDFETRCAIIQNKAENHSVSLDQDLVEFLAKRVQSNVRELEGELNQLLAFCEMRNLSPNVNIATALFGAQVARPKHISPKQIIERTAKYFDIPMDELLSPRRDKEIVLPRQVAMYLLRSELHLSFPKIAQELGRKDHTTAMHSVEKMSKELQFDALLKDQIKEIMDSINA
jgi:chromosomal replication initiator protein